MITGDIMKRIWLNTFILAITLVFSSSAWTQTKTRINWTAVTGAQSGMFMAQQEGLFKKNGLDVELIHIPSSSRGIQAIGGRNWVFLYGRR
jgi:ABC-type nitrate/sulfonate/bicarbonate transport system substrate-binding protein